MSEIDRLLENARRYAEKPLPGDKPVQPGLHVAVVACMDSRLDLFGVLGLEIGDAHLIRNAGGVVTADVIRSLSISQRKLETREVVLIHHTDCGMLKVTDYDFKAELEADTGLRPEWAVEAFTDTDADLRQSILRVRTNPYLPHRDAVRGFVYDVADHTLREVVVDDVPPAG
jgi:carbonic anhydrase